MGWLEDTETLETERWQTSMDMVLRDDDRLLLTDMFRTFPEALESFESEKKKHSRNMVIRKMELRVTTVFDGSHIEYEDAYGAEPDERGFVRRRSWADVDKEGRESIPVALRSVLFSGLCPVMENGKYDRFCDSCFRSYEGDKCRCDEEQEPCPYCKRVPKPVECVSKF